MTQEFESTLNFQRAVYKKELFEDNVFGSRHVTSGNKFSYDYIAKSLYGIGALQPVDRTSSEPALTVTSDFQYDPADNAKSILFSISNQSLPVNTAVALSSGTKGPVEIPHTTIKSPGLIASTSRPASDFGDDTELTLKFWLEEQEVVTGASLTLEIKAELDDDKEQVIGKTIWVLAKE